MSNIGKETETILQSTGLITITESFYLTFIGEVGLIFCLPIFYALYLSLKSLSKRYFYIVALPLLLECVVGLGLLNPIISYMSFLLIKVAHEKNIKLTIKLILYIFLYSVALLVSKRIFSISFKCKKIICYKQT